MTGHGPEADPSIGHGSALHHSPAVGPGRARGTGPTPGGEARPAARPPAHDAGLVEVVRRRLVESGQAATAAHLAALLREEAGPRGDVDRLALASTLRSELTGLGPLEPLLADPDVTDILVNAPDEVWVDRGAGLERAPASFGDDDAVRRLAVRLAAAVGRRLDTASPFVDARLPDGSRLHAVLRPVSTRGTCLSVRVLRQRVFTLGYLTLVGTIAAGVDELLAAMVRARLAMLVSGGTGTGKTTLLGVLCALAGPSERLVVVEDAAELSIDHPHAVRLETRPPNVEGAGAVVLRDLVRQALRMRPDRLVVGEVRGAEIADLLLALNTGHEGGLSTVHANSAGDVPARLEALGALAGLGREALHSQLAPAVQAVVHLGRDVGGDRQVREIGLLVHGRDGLVRCVPALRRPADPRDGGLIVREGAGMLAHLLRERGVQPPPILRGSPAEPTVRSPAGSGPGSASASAVAPGGGPARVEATVGRPRPADAFRSELPPPPNPPEPRRALQEPVTARPAPELPKRMPGTQFRDPWRERADPPTGEVAW